MVKDRNKLTKQAEDEQYLEYLQKNNKELREKCEEWELAIEDANKKYGGSKYVGLQLGKIQSSLSVANFFLFVLSIVFITFTFVFSTSFDNGWTNLPESSDYESFLKMVESNCGTTHIVERYDEYYTFATGRELCQNFNSTISGDDKYGYYCYIPLKECISKSN